MAKNVNVSGLKELNRTLEQLPRKLQDQAVKNAMAAGARKIRDEAKNLVPVRTGTLKENIVVSRTVKKGGKRRSLKGSVVIGIKDEARFYAHLIEFGTSQTSAQPFLRPAFDAKHDEALQVIGKKIGDQVEKKARKLSGMSSAKQRKAFSQ